MLTSLLSFFAQAPIIIYHNVETDKSIILTDNKGKAGIYKWTHKESGKIYIGSAVDLSRRLSKYFSSSELKRADNYISRAIISHTHSAFSLSILEYIDISTLSIQEARKLILSREQHYIDSLLPEYNINPIAGSRLGSLHSNETRAKMSEAKSSVNHPLFGKAHSAETLAKMSLAKSGENHPMFGRIGEKHPMFGKNLSANTKALMSIAKSGENHPLYGKTHSAETKAKISAANGITIYVYDADKTTLVNSFASARKAGEYFNCCHKTIKRYALNGSIFKDKWILSYTNT